MEPAGRNPGRFFVWGDWRHAGIRIIEQRHVTNLPDIVQDVRYGLRQLRRSPGFFALATLLIGIGIAATTQIFTLVDTLLLRPLPVRNPENLVQLFEQTREATSRSLLRLRLL